MATVKPEATSVMVEVGVALHMYTHFLPSSSSMYEVELLPVAVLYRNVEMSISSSVQYVQCR